MIGMTQRMDPNELSGPDEYVVQDYLVEIQRAINQMKAKLDAYSDAYRIDPVAE